MTPPTWTSSSSDLLAEISQQFTARSAGTSTGRPAVRPPLVLHSARRPALVLVAHGSRDPAALAEIRRLLALLRGARPELDVRLAHLGLNAPLLPDVLAELAGPVVLVPLLLGRGYHVKVDLPALLAAAPQVSGTITAPLGPDGLLTEVLYERLVEAGWTDPATVRERQRHGRDAVVLAASGSRDPDAAADTEAQARLLARRLHVPVVPGYVAAGSPSVAEAVAGLSARGYRRIAVAGYFTAPGDFARLAAAAGDWLTSAPLGAHELMARLVLARYEHSRLRTAA
ncbi:sirohydrochlorin chelatase [Kitasatospora herbaricolor]|uniref:Sirohydrochlorin chelatase n=1 Tax=Kitasatospora herbaricolor TaxID=68217 RepID=A0ABZ1WE39_9ACTN|nr:sirohydrochlorin chelatase [Kitasatospora herbaricolor]